MNRLQTKFLGVDFKNPIVTSSGCFGFGLEYRDYFDPNVLGGIVVKGLTMEPRDGNYGTRIAETPGGMLNCVGLENPGIDYFETHILKDMKEAGITTNIIANINGKTVEEYIEIAKRVEKIKEVDIIELNISCPNVKDGGMAFGANPEVAGRVTREVRKVTTKPLVVKYPLPKSLTLYTADQNNSTQSVITDLSGNSVQTGNLVEDNVYYEDTHYSFDITSFIQNNLGTAGQSREKLQLFLSDNDFYNTVQGVIFGDSKHPVNDHNNNVSLTIYYKTYTK